MSSTKSTTSLYQRAITLFQNVPILYVLCYEVFIGQAVSTLLSYMFITYTKQSIPQDHERASHTGKVYGRINLLSGVLQFALLPYVLGRRRQQKPQQQRDCPMENTDNSSPNQLSNGHLPKDAGLHSQHRNTIPVDWYWLLLPTILGVSGIVMILAEPQPTTPSDLEDVVVTTTIGMDTIHRFDVVTLSYSTMKILEYSLRVALVERVRH